MEIPKPSSGELVVAVSAVGVNFIDTYLRSGVYKTSFPHTPGSEGSGTIIALGPDTADFNMGDRVIWNAAPGSYATHVRVPAANAVRVPAGIDLSQAAAIPLQGLTAHYLATSSFPIHRDDVVLIHAGAGGVGLILTQIAKTLGAKVVTTVSTAAKEELSREAGADHAIRYDQLHDLTKELPPLIHAVSQNLRQTHGSDHHLDDGRGSGVDAVYDGVGLTTFEASLASLRTRGSLVLFGGASGQVPQFDLQRLNAHGSLTITRPSLGHFILTREELSRRYADLFRWVSQGNLVFRVGQTFALRDAGLAQQSLESRATTGKVLLIP